MNSVVEEVRAAVNGRHPLVYLYTPEEGRVLAALRELAAEFEDGKVSSWTCLDGLDGSHNQDTRHPVAAIQAFMERPHPGFCVLKDLPSFMENGEVIRALRNAYYALLDRPNIHIVIVSPVLCLPEQLNKEICLIDVPLPEPDELMGHALHVQKQYPKLEIPWELRPEISLALRGLTLAEAGHVMHRAFQAGRMEEESLLDEIFAEKRMLMRKSGFLEYVPQRIRIENIGGLDVLKEWAGKRRKLFTQDAVDAGLPVPRGILMMGISGCGKSMSAKAIACLWRVPLFRLDMNLVFSGIYGNPQAAFHRALKGIESIAPAVLWIDEIENALGMTTETVTAEQSLTFSSFLTWMQESPPLIFVAATANRIESLPAEILRKGRFDEVFFCDLPTDEERREIIRIHLRLNGVDPDTIAVDRLLFSTEGWTGAEIEQAVIAARVDAEYEGRKLSLDDVRRHTIRMVPLSQTMVEQIKAIRSWSHNRATRASKAAPKTMLPT